MLYSHINKIQKNYGIKYQRNSFKKKKPNFSIISFVYLKASAYFSNIIIISGNDYCVCITVDLEIF